MSSVAGHKIEVAKNNYFVLESKKRCCETEAKKEERNGIKFICPICNSNAYKEIFEDSEFFVHKSRGRRRTHCVCLGCSVMFEDPEKFSIKSMKI